MGFRVCGEEVDFNNPESLRSALPCLKFGYAFLIFGAIFLYFISADRFVCFRSKNICEIQAQHVWNITYHTKQTIPLSDILKAEVNSYHNNDQARMYQVILKTKTGDAQLFNTSSSNYPLHDNRAQDINTFLYSQDEMLDIKDSRWWLLFPIPFFLIGFLCSVYLPYRFKKRIKELENQDKTHAHLSI